MKIAEQIINVLRKETIIVFSWGFHNLQKIEDGVMFNVQGFVFTGAVMVLYDKTSDTFTVRLYKVDGTCHHETINVHSDKLVDTIDELVEKNCSDEEYKNKVYGRYSNQDVQHL